MKAYTKLIYTIVYIRITSVSGPSKPNKEEVTAKKSKSRETSRSSPRHISIG
jgi:hypothetical protein